MTEGLPDPLTPADCDLRDFPRLMVDIQRLRTSEFDAITDDTAWRAGLNLWMSAFHNIPAASLADGDATFCKAAGLGRDIETWRRVKDDAMRGWRLCSDGRWYHVTLSEFALEAWLEKLSQRLTGAAGNKVRWGVQFDEAPLKDAIAASLAMLKALNPASKAIAKVTRRITPKNGDGIAPRSQADRIPIPEGSQVEGEGEGKGKQKKKDRAPTLPLGAAEASKPSVFQIPDWVPVPAWEGFALMRKKHRWHLTDRAAELIVKELEKLRAAGHDPAAVLDQSTRNSWRDVYAIKSDRGNNNGNHQAPPSNSHGSGINRAVRRRNQFGLNGVGGPVIDVDARPAGEGGPAGQNLLLGPDDLAA